MSGPPTTPIPTGVPYDNGRWVWNPYYGYVWSPTTPAAGSPTTTAAGTGATATAGTGSPPTTGRRPGSPGSGTTATTAGARSAGGTARSSSSTTAGTAITITATASRHSRSTIIIRKNELSAANIQRTAITRDSISQFSNRSIAFRGNAPSETPLIFKGGRHQRPGTPSSSTSRVALFPRKITGRTLVNPGTEPPIAEPNPGVPIFRKDTPFPISRSSTPNSEVRKKEGTESTSSGPAYYPRIRKKRQLGIRWRHFARGGGGHRQASSQGSGSVDRSRSRGGESSSSSGSSAGDGPSARKRTNPPPSPASTRVPPQHPRFNDLDGKRRFFPFRPPPLPVLLFRFGRFVFRPELRRLHPFPFGIYPELLQLLRDSLLPRFPFDRLLLAFDYLIPGLPVGRFLFPFGYFPRGSPQKKLTIDRSHQGGFDANPPFFLYHFA